MADLDSRSVGNMRQNAQNKEQTSVVRNSNRFPLDYSHSTSHRYADIGLFYHYYGERGDRVPLRTGHSVRTFTMKTPNEIDIYMRKHFVHIPLKSIYPYTWDEVLYPLPVDGDTAPLDGRFNINVIKLLNMLDYCSYKIPKDWGHLNELLRIYDLISYFLSNGSLLAAANIHLSSGVRMNDENYFGISFDRFYSQFLLELSDALKGCCFTIRYTDPDGNLNQFYLSYGDNVNAQVTVYSFHKLLEYFRYCDYNFSIFLTYPDSDFPSTRSFYIRASEGSVDPYINCDIIAAYQLSAAQFYTNDRVDDIFSAESYRNYIQQLMFEIYSPEYFEFNGVTYLYDIFSQHYFDKLISDLKTFADDAFDENYSNLSSKYLKAIGLLSEIFSFRQSLRFGDYFTGARVSPLAVGESSVPITGDGVLVEDITKSAALQRLRYNINVIGRKINNQLQQLIPGKAPRTPDDIPTSIASQDFNIGKDSTSVSNTGEAQIDPNNPLAVTQYLNSGASDFAFEVELTEPCIILGMVSFSVPRIYSNTIDRFAFHHDRYDMFIPQMQFIGDQEIYRKELFGFDRDDVDLPFAYNQQYSEYKQRYSFASGAFVEFLPSWDMITDNEDGLLTYHSRVLSPLIAHSINSEFDRFYQSLLGYSLADYFHFIVKHYNTSTPERAMAWNPQPLL